MRPRRDKVYSVWAEMVQRCTNPRHKAYANYGGRGITVADEWRNFSQFTADMGPRPDDGTLDRIDNNAGYSAANCRWATRQEQNSNRRNCIIVNCDGEAVTLREACRRLAVPYRPIVKRVRDRGWPVDRALNTPLAAVKNFGGDR